MAFREKNSPEHTPPAPRPMSGKGEQNLRILSCFKEIFAHLLYFKLVKASATFLGYSGYNIRHIQLQFKSFSKKLQVE